MKKYRTVEFYKSYFEDFFVTLDNKVKEKFIWTFQLIEEVEIIPKKYLKHIGEGIYEIRVKQGSNIFRVFAFFEENKIIIAVNGFVKKTQKTPKGEIQKAIKIRREYESEKK